MLPPPNDGSVLGIAIDLFPPEAFSELSKCMKGKTEVWRKRKALEVMRADHELDVEDWDILNLIDRVELSFKAPEDALDTLAHLYADELGTRFWRSGRFSESRARWRCWNDRSAAEHVATVQGKACCNDQSAAEDVATKVHGKARP